MLLSILLVAIFLGVAYAGLTVAKGFLKIVLLAATILVAALFAIFVGFFGVIGGIACLVTFGDVIWIIIVICIILAIIKKRRRP